jgi:aminopeptidase N
MIKFLIFFLWFCAGFWLPISAQTHVEQHLDIDELACLESKKYHLHQLMEIESNTGYNYDLIHCRLEWNLDPTQTFISGKVTNTFLYTATDSLVEFDLAQNMVVDSIYYHGERILSFAHTGGKIKITLTNTLQPGQKDSVSIFYKGAPITTGFGSFYKATHAGVPIVWTLSQPYGAKDWWPCKNTLTDKIDSLDVFIKTSNKYVGVSNGVLVSETPVDTFKVYHWRHRYPITTYLVAVAVTNYTRYTDKVPVPGHDSLLVWNYVYPETVNLTRQATKNVVRQIQFFDSLFMRYPFHKEQYSHAQFSWGGGMEHQTMSFMGSFGFDLMAHELAHQWFGNYITCRSFKDIWLNEGFATYLNALANERFNPTIWQNWKTGASNNIMSQPGGSLMVDDTLDVGRIFNGRLSYNKGAFFLHMLRWHLGDSLFFAGIRSYLSDPDVKFGYATTAQLKANFEAVSGQDLGYYFTNWYEKEGFPTINYLCDLSDNGLVTLTLNQTTSHPSVSFFPIKIPFRFRLGSYDTTVAVWHLQNGQVTTFNLGELASEVLVDPDRWLIARFEGNVITSKAKTIANSPTYLLSPNPALNKVNISNLSADKTHTLQLTDIHGKKLLSQVFTGSEKVLDITHLKQGFYFISIDGMPTQKLIIAK